MSCLVFLSCKAADSAFLWSLGNDAVVFLRLTQPSPPELNGGGWVGGDGGRGDCGALLLRNEPFRSLSLEQLGWNNYIACAKLNSTHCERIERVYVRVIKGEK